MYSIRDCPKTNHAGSRAAGLFKYKNGRLCGLIELLMSVSVRLRRGLRNLLSNWLGVYEMAVHLQDEPHRQDGNEFEGKNNDIGGEGDCHGIKCSRHDQARKRTKIRLIGSLPVDNSRGAGGTNANHRYRENGQVFEDVIGKLGERLGQDEVISKLLADEMQQRRKNMSRRISWTFNAGGLSVELFGAIIRS